jgi:hypothetical protein
LVNYTLATRAVQADISLMTILLILALGTVFVILCLGLFTLVKGGEISRQWSNRLMRYRVMAQAVALILVALMFLTKH